MPAKKKEIQTHPKRRSNGDRTKFSENQRAKSLFKPGVCRRCGLRKPRKEFPPRTTQEPEWYPHHGRCKECVNEQAKASTRKKLLETFREALPYRSVTNLLSEKRFLTDKLRAINDELKQRTFDVRG